MDRLSKDLDKECRASLKVNYTFIFSSVMSRYVILCYLIMSFRTLQEHDVRLHMGLSEDAFASRLGGRARDLLQNV